jgi:hypothetical protein
MNIAGIVSLGDLSVSGGKTGRVIAQISKHTGSIRSMYAWNIIVYQHINIALGRHTILKESNNRLILTKRLKRRVREFSFAVFT